MLKIFVVLISLVLWPKCHSASQNISLKEGECPERDAIPYCMCEESRQPFGVTVDCHGFPSPKPLMEHLKEMNEYKIDTFHLFYPSFDVAPSNLFQNVSITTLLIAECNLTTLTSKDDLQKSFLEGLKTKLVNFNVFYCPEFAFWNWTLLSGMSALKSIHVSASPIEIINKSVSKINQGKLKTITFYGTKTQIIEEGAFESHLDIVAINLRDNDLLQIKRNIFPKPASSLRMIGLGGNNLTELPNDIFDSMPLLEEIELESNLFKYLNEKAFQPIWNQLRSLYIGGSNPFHCDCKMSWLLNSTKYPRPLYEDFSTAICFSPTILKGRTILSLVQEDLQCSQ